MLDYDALRSKVRKLAEKPDKDASRLPRTEKELEMVSNNSSLGPPKSASALVKLPRYPRSRKNFQRCHSDTPTISSIESASSLESDTLAELEMPSPPKVLGTVNRRTSDRIPPMEPLLEEHTVPYLPHTIVAVQSPERTVARSASLAGLTGTPSRIVASRNSLHSSPTTSAKDLPGSTTSPTRVLERSLTLTSLSSIKSGDNRRYSCSTHESVLSSSPAAITTSRLRPVFGLRSVTASPLMSTMELDRIMQPIKEDFVRKHADKVLQAKAAYDQLNDQLTSELPQLIDLRYVMDEYRHETGSTHAFLQSTVSRSFVRGTGQDTTTLLCRSL